MLRRVALSQLFLLSTLAFAHSARAQTAIALDRYDPTPAGDAFFAVLQPHVAKNLQFDAGVWLSYAHQPLSLYREDPATNTRDRVSIVSYQLTPHIMAALSVSSRFKVDVDVPFVAQNSGFVPTQAGRAFPDTADFVLADIRVGARFLLVRSEGLKPSLSLSTLVFLPTGNADAYAGTQEVRIFPSIVLGGANDRLLWSATMGRKFQQSKGFQNGAGGSEFVFGAAAAMRFKSLQLGPELVLATISDTGTSAFSRATTNAELLLGAKYRHRNLNFGLAFGPAFGGGFGAGVGTPAFRIIGGLNVDFERTAKASLAPIVKQGPPPEPEWDVIMEEDGQSSRADGTQHATLATATNDRTRDTDGDGVPDKDDLCPRVVGESGPTAKRLGCPSDQDGDGVADVDDKCPTESGQDTSPARLGCPLDSDGDGITDDKDACPHEKGVASPDPKAHGCAPSVRMSGTQIVILQQVQFETGKAEIKAESFSLLEQIAKLLNEHADLVRIAIDGHTDNVGSVRSNTELSQRRSVSVLTWLVQHGVDTRRLESRAFGPRNPLVPNTSAEGRAKNRRVEFTIRKRSPNGKADWKDGPID